MNRVIAVGVGIFLVAGIGLIAMQRGGDEGQEGVTDSVDIFVTTPWRDLFERPLGDI